MKAQETAPVRLTSLAHGGGCGCKLAPGGARADHRGERRRGMDPAGAARRHRDQRRRRRLPDQRDPGHRRHDRLLHAHRGRPVRLRRHRRDQRDLRRVRDGRRVRSSRWRSSACPSTSCRSRRSAAILEGGESVCQRAGIPVAGGHSVDSVEPIYGLVAIGLVDPRHLKRNAGARPGDTIVLGKPLGVGIYSAALKKQQISAAQYGQ